MSETGEQGEGVTSEKGERREVGEGVREGEGTLFHGGS